MDRQAKSGSQAVVSSKQASSSSKASPSSASPPRRSSAVASSLSSDPVNSDNQSIKGQHRRVSKRTLVHQANLDEEHHSTFSEDISEEGESIARRTSTSRAASARARSSIYEQSTSSRKRPNKRARRQQSLSPLEKQQDTSVSEIETRSAKRRRETTALQEAQTPLRRTSARNNSKSAASSSSSRTRESRRRSTTETPLQNKRRRVESTSRIQESNSKMTRKGKGRQGDPVVNENLDLADSAEDESTAEKNPESKSKGVSTSSAMDVDESNAEEAERTVGVEGEKERAEREEGKDEDGEEDEEDYEDEEEGDGEQSKPASEETGGSGGRPSGISMNSGLGISALAYGMSGGSGMSSRFKEWLLQLKNGADPTLQLVALQDLAEFLSIATEDMFVGHGGPRVMGFHTDEFVKALVGLLQPPSPEESSGAAAAALGLGADLPPELMAELGLTNDLDGGMGMNPELMLLACRCLSNLIEALPSSTMLIVQNGGVNVLMSKLMEVEYIDLAEQVLSVLEKISVEYPGAVIRANGLLAVLQYIDFFSLHVQRTAVMIAANACRALGSVTSQRGGMFGSGGDDTPSSSPGQVTPEQVLEMVKDAVPTLERLLLYSDQKLVEQTVRCLGTIVEWCYKTEDKLQLLVSQSLLKTIIGLVNPANVTGSSEGTSTGLANANSTTTLYVFSQLVKILTNAVRGSPQLGSLLVTELEIVGVIRGVLSDKIGVRLEVFKGEDEQKRQEELQRITMAVMNVVVNRPADQILEVLTLASEVLPALPKDSEVWNFRVPKEKKDGKGMKVDSEKVGEVAEATMEVDEKLEPVGAPGSSTSSSSSVNLTASSTRTSMIQEAQTKLVQRDQEQKDRESRRLSLLRANPAQLGDYVTQLVPVLIEVFGATVNAAVRRKVVECVAKGVWFALEVTDKDIGADVLGTFGFGKLVSELVGMRETALRGLSKKHEGAGSATTELSSSTSSEVPPPPGPEVHHRERREALLLLASGVQIAKVAMDKGGPGFKLWFVREGVIKEMERLVESLEEILEGGSVDVQGGPSVDVSPMTTRHLPMFGSTVRGEGSSSGGMIGGGVGRLTELVQDLKRLREQVAGQVGSSSSAVGSAASENAGGSVAAAEAVSATSSKAESIDEKPGWRDWIDSADELLKKVDSELQTPSATDVGGSKDESEGVDETKDEGDAGSRKRRSNRVSAELKRLSTGTSGIPRLKVDTQNKSTAEQQSSPVSPSLNSPTSLIANMRGMLERLSRGTFGSSESSATSSIPPPPPRSMATTHPFQAVPSVVGINQQRASEKQVLEWMLWMCKRIIEQARKADEGDSSSEEMRDGVLEELRRLGEKLGGSKGENDMELDYGDEIRETLRALQIVAQHFAGGGGGGASMGGVTGYEVLESGVLDGLMSYLTMPGANDIVDGNEKVKTASLSLNVRLRMFVHVFLNGPTPDPNYGNYYVSNAMRMLVQRLQESLSRVERFEIATAFPSTNSASFFSEGGEGLLGLLSAMGGGGGGRDGVKPSLQLGRQIKIKLVAEEPESVPRQYSTVLVSVHAVGTYRALEEYLKPRVSVTGASGSSATTSEPSSADGSAEGSSTTNAEAEAVSGVKEKSEDTKESEDEKVSAGPSFSAGEGVAATKGDIEGESKDAEKKEGNEDEDGSDEEDEEEGEGAENYEDEEDEEDEEEDDDFGGDEVMNVSDLLLHSEEQQRRMRRQSHGEASEGEDESAVKSEALQDEGGRTIVGDGEAESVVDVRPSTSESRPIAGPSDGNSPSAPVASGSSTSAMNGGERDAADHHEPPTVVSDSAPQASASTSTTRSYAQAAGTSVNSFSIQFSLGDQVIPREMTIFGSIYRHEQQRLREAAGSDTLPVTTVNVWSNVFTIKYKKIATSPASNKGSRSNTPRLTSSPGRQLFEKPTIFATGDEKTSGESALPRLRTMLPYRLDLMSVLDKDTYPGRIMYMLHLLHGINSRWTEIYVDEDGVVGGEEEGESRGSSGEALSINPLVPSAFQNNKLTAKLNRQLDEPLIVASHVLPSWCSIVAKDLSFLVPFETRLVYLQSTSFGYSRSMGRWQQQNAPQANAGSGRGGSGLLRGGDMGSIGRIQRQKVRISRSRIVDSMLKVMELYGSAQALLEVEFFDEVGTGLGPTLEFYAQVSKDVRRRKGVTFCGSVLRNVWRDDLPAGNFLPGGSSDSEGPQPMDESELAGESSTSRSPAGAVAAAAEQSGTNGGSQLPSPAVLALEEANKAMDSEIRKAARKEVDVDEFLGSYQGLFPSPMLRSVAEGESGKKTIDLFKCLGTFVAKALLDSRLVDLPFNPIFLEMVVGQEEEQEQTAENVFGDVGRTGSELHLIKHIDKPLYTSLMDLKKYSQAKRAIEKDESLTGVQRHKAIEEVTMKGARLEDLCLDFTLPGFPDMELKPGGRDVNVTMGNVEEYVQLVVDATVGSGVRKQIEAFRKGFNRVFPVTDLRTFSVQELGVLVSGSEEEDWSVETLMDAMKPDHGYNQDSRPIKYLVEMMSTFQSVERREFLQFVTGSPKLPIGGFKALSPCLTVVCKNVEGGRKPDDYLPSVMTCVNYLKVPQYSDVDVMRRRFEVAMREGQGCFHLS